MKYLEGEYFDENMLHVDYDEVSTNISDFVLSYDLDLMNGTLLTNVRSKVFFRYPYVTYNWISLGNVVKCFGFEITNSNVKTMRINLIRDIFPARIRPSDGGFAMLLHYSNQVTWSYRTVKRIWPSHDKTSNFKLGMILKGMTVYVQRYKYRLNNCIWNWKQYDQITIQNHINKMGCKVPYQGGNYNGTLCKNKTANKESRFRFSLQRNGVPPCRSIDKIEYENNEKTEIYLQTSFVRLAGAS